MYHILVVDDERHVTDALTLLLHEQTDMDAEVFAANSAAEALDIMNRYRIDLMLSDINMPDMSGIELLEATRTRWPLCQVVMLTGYSDFNHVYEAFRLKAAGFLLKTEPDEVVIRTVQTLLQQSANRFKQETLDIPPSAAKPDPHLLRLVSADVTHRRRILADLGFAPDAGELVACLCTTPGEHTAQQLDTLMRRHLNNRVIHAVYAPTAGDHTLWLMQLAPEACSLPLLSSILETVQDICRSLTGREVSFALSPVTLDELPLTLSKLRSVLDKTTCDPGSIVTLTNSLPTNFGADSAVRFVKDYIAQHVTEGLTISTLSQVSGYNADYLTRIFRNATGETISQYLTSYRMDMILRLLRDPLLSVDEISKQTGFSSRSYFNRFVKRATGMNPKALRMNLSNHP